MIGDMRSRIHLYAPVEAADEGGGVESSEIEIGYAWADLTFSRVAEDAGLGRTRMRRQVEALMRSRAGVERGVRFTHRGISYRVYATAFADARGRYTRLLAEEERR